MVYRQTPRSQAVRAASRDRILSAALTLFGEKGYDATTMKDIVAEAGTSIGNAYFYFGSKENLVAELIESVSRATLEASERAAASLPPGPLRIAAMIASRVGSFFTTNRPLARLLLDTDQRLGTIQIMEDIAVERWIPQLAECFPDLPEEDLPAIGTAIWGVNRAIVSRVARGRLDPGPKDVVAFAVRWTLRALGVPEREIDEVLPLALSAAGELRAELEST